MASLPNEAVAESVPGAEPIGRLRWQFSIRQMLVLTLAVALGLFIFFYLPKWCATIAIGIVSILGLVALIAAVVYGRDNVRAFSVGALVPASMVGFAAAYLSLIAMFSMYERMQFFETLEEISGGMLAIFGVSWTLAFFAGLVAIFVRRRVTRE